MIGLVLSSLCAARAAEVDYERDVAPIFRAYCAGCHNDVELESDFSLETYAQLREGGDRDDPIVPGAPAESFIIRSTRGLVRPNMPPRDAAQPPESAKATLERWVAEGAKGPAVDRSILRSLVAPSIPPGVDAASSAITALACSRDGARLAIGRFARVEIRDARSYAMLRAIDGLPGKVNALEFSAEGAKLVVATGISGLSGEAWIVDIGDAAKGGGAAPLVLGGHRDVLYDAALSPDGELVATAGYDRRIRLWRSATGELLREIDVHKGAVFDLEFDPSGRVLASASADETVKLWRVADGVRLDTLNQPQGEQVAVVFAPDAVRIASVGADRRIHLWRFVSTDAPELNPVELSRFAHESPIVALRLARSGELAITAAGDGTLKVWSFPELVEIAAYEAQPDVVAAIVEIPQEERFVVGRLDGSIESYALPARSATAAAETIAATAPPPVAAPAPSAEPMRALEVEPNDAPDAAQRLSAIPAVVEGAIAHPGDADSFVFSARAGEELVLEVDAARSGSKLDSRIDVLDANGAPIERVRLQALRDSWFTFRGKDADTSDDFRLHNWREMELDQYLWANGEVVRLWLYPRGPDSGFKVYPGSGKRHTAFGTTALSHALGEPCYIVTPLPPGSEPAPNGLPLLSVFYENDDDPERRFGRDSVLRFTAPENGDYIARIRDVRGFGSAESFHYKLAVRARRPDFKVSIGGRGAKVSPRSGRELSFDVERFDGFEGSVRIDIDGLPADFTATTPVVIEAGQIAARGAIYAAAGASTPSAEAARAVRVTATATLAGVEATRAIGDLGELQVGPAAKLAVEILGATDDAPRDESGRLVFTIRPGETIAARVRATRHDFAARIELGKEDSGRNLPHGVFIDNIGLNGLLIVEGQTEREFVITAAPIAEPTTRLFHLRADADGGQCSQPAVLRVLRPVP